MQTGVGRPSLVAGGPRPRPALRLLQSRVDVQLVVGRIARTGRRKEENQSGRAGTRGRLPEVSRAGRGRRPTDRLAEREGAVFLAKQPSASKNRNKKKEPGGPDREMEKQGPGSRGHRRWKGLFSLLTFPPLILLLQA